jgi:hypothetical protein
MHLPALHLPPFSKIGLTKAGQQARKTEAQCENVHGTRLQQVRPILVGMSGDGMSFVNFPLATHSNSTYSEVHHLTCSSTSAFTRLWR